MRHPEASQAPLVMIDHRAGVGEWSLTTVGASAPHWSSSVPSELRITRVSRCVAHGFKGRAGFKFAGRLRWPSLAADRGSGASRGTRPQCIGRVLGGAASCHVPAITAAFRPRQVPRGHGASAMPFGAGSLSAPDGTTVTWGRTDGTIPTGMTADPGWACAAFICHQNGTGLGVGLAARSRGACSEEPRRRTGCQEVRS